MNDRADEEPRSWERRAAVVLVSLVVLLASLAWWATRPREGAPTSTTSALSSATPIATPIATTAPTPAASVEASTSSAHVVPPATKRPP